jgi:hypothetical protein
MLDIYTALYGPVPTVPQNQPKFLSFYPAVIN